MGVWQDRAARVMKICTETFTTEFTYVPVVGAPVPGLKGVFNDPYVEGIALDGAPFQTKFYRLGVRRDQIASPVAVPPPGNTDKVIINSVTYRIHEVQPDGDAGHVLLLHKDV